MADDPDSHGLTKAQANIMGWVDLYMQANWYPQWTEKELFDKES